MAAQSIACWLPCVPPRVTAQQKRMRVGLGGQVRFFHGPAMLREAETWAVYLVRDVPALPLSGPISLLVRFVYPWPAKASRADRARILPKTTKPDLDNAAKHLIDLLVRMRFLVGDEQIARLELSKWWGPDGRVGIGVRIESLVLGEAADLNGAGAGAEIGRGAGRQFTGERV